MYSDGKYLEGDIEETVLDRMKTLKYSENVKGTKPNTLLVLLGIRVVLIHWEFRYGVEGAKKPTQRYRPRLFYIVAL